MGTCAPVLSAALSQWVSFGGGNSGCYGNAAHTYGFHRAANQVPSSDYSRRRDPAGPSSPVNWDWACAADFGHNNNTALLSRLTNVLARLQAGDPSLSMVCEYIGRAKPGGPVMYWFRGDGLSRYTGAGHDTWSHISVWRSRANQAPPLWTPGQAPVAPAPPPSGAPHYPGYYLRYNPSHYDGNVKTWQAHAAWRGYHLVPDGYFGNITLGVVKLFQSQKHYSVDGIIGPVTWNGLWQ